MTHVNDSQGIGSTNVTHLLSPALVSNKSKRLMPAAFKGRDTMNQRDTTPVNDPYQRQSMPGHDMTRHDTTHDMTGQDRT